MLACSIFLAFGLIWVVMQNQAEGQRDMVSRGAYMVETVGACGQCHTPRVGSKPDPDRHLAGHPANMPSPQYDNSLLQRGIFMVTGPSMTAYALPFGTVHASNLTPDEETGIGTWSEAIFIKTMQTGHHLGETNNRQILPPMPIRYYQEIAETDLKAIWAYLKTIKPIKNEVPPPLNPRGRPY